jgi:FtsZ-interacting cell division protein ZipA
MSELQIGLLAIGVLVVTGVLVYNRVQERGAKRAAQRAFRSEHVDVLLEEPARESGVEREPTRAPARTVSAGAAAAPDPAIDYIIEFASDQPAAQALVHEQWGPIERRHARRALLASSAEGKTWRAGLQLVSRDGAIGEADLIEFRSAVETLAASVGATVSAPEMRAAVEAARALDQFCADTDIQVVIHVQGGPFPGPKIDSAAEAAGMTLGADGRFGLYDDTNRLLYTLGARDGAALTAAGMREAAPVGLSLALDVARVPDTRRSFESMARLAHQLAAILGGSIVDDNGNTLDERAVAAIAAQLDAVSSRLEAHGLPPGGPAALRLFS